MVDTAMHELMHFMFHQHFEQDCLAKGLSSSQVWQIKESLTVLLNEECNDLMFIKDRGYPEQHQYLRELISQTWRDSKDFNKVLEFACQNVKS